MKRLAVACLVLGVLCWLAMASGLVRPWAMNLGRVSVFASREMLGIGVGSRAVDARVTALTPWPLWQFKGMGARVLVAPESRVRPSVSRASMTVGPAAMNVRVMWVPLWLPGLTLLIGAVVARRYSRTPEAGHCPACNYDLAGLATGVCPECSHRATPV